MISKVYQELEHSDLVTEEKTAQNFHINTRSFSRKSYSFTENKNNK